MDIPHTVAIITLALVDLSAAGSSILIGMITVAHMVQIHMAMVTNKYVITIMDVVTTMITPTTTTTMATCLGGGPAILLYGGFGGSGLFFAASDVALGGEDSSN